MLCMISVQKTKENQEGGIADLPFNSDHMRWLKVILNLMTTLRDFTVNRDSWDSDWYVQLGMSAML